MAFMPAAYKVVVPVMAWALLIPATVSVPDEAVSDPALTVNDDVEVRPAAENVVCAVIAFELVIPATLNVPELAVIEPAEIVIDPDVVRPAVARLDVPVIAPVLVIPATVSVPADAVIEPAAIVNDAVDVRPAVMIVPSATMSLSMIKFPPWTCTPPEDTQRPPAVMLMPALETVMPPIRNCDISDFQVIQPHALISAVRDVRDR